MQLFKRGKLFWVRFSVGGKQYRRPTGEKNKEAATARGVDIWNAMRSGEATPAKKSPTPTLQQFTEGYFLQWVAESSRIKDKTRASYRYGALLLRKQSIYPMPLHRITAEDVDMVKVDGSPSTHNCALRTLRRIFSLAIAKDHIAKSPKISLLEENRRSRLIEPATEAKMADVFAMKRRRNGSLSTALYVILDCGMRPMEIAQMRVGDVDFSQGLIHIPKSKTRAGARVLPMTDRVKELLFVRVGGRTEGWVFPSPRYHGRCIQSTSLTQAWRKAATLAGLPKDVNLYCARHTFATDAMRATGNAFMVMKALGHTELSTTQRYQHHELAGIGELMNERNRARALVN